MCLIAQNGAGSGPVNVGGLSPELVPAQIVSENVSLSGAGDVNVGKLLAQILPAVLAQSQSDRAAMEKRYEDKLLQQKAANVLLSSLESGSFLEL